MAAAKDTQRLDLSTWQHRASDDFVLTSVPRGVWRVTNLKELWLTNNDLTELPPQVNSSSDVMNSVVFNFIVPLCLFHLFR
jgi:Leucine-rich repeat (LRR) protein